MAHVRIQSKSHNTGINHLWSTNYCHWH